MVAPRHRRAARRSIADEPARCRMNDDPVGAIWGKFLPQIALSGFVTSKAYFAERGLRLEPSSRLRRHFQGQGHFEHVCIGEPDMPKAVRLSPLISTPAASSEKSNNNQLISIALFSSIGLLVSLLAVLMGVSGAWS